MHYYAQPFLFSSCGQLHFYVIKGLFFRSQFKVQSIVEGNEGAGT